MDDAYLKVLKQCRTYCISYVDDITLFYIVGKGEDIKATAHQLLGRPVQEYRKYVVGVVMKGNSLLERVCFTPEEDYVRTLDSAVKFVPLDFYNEVFVPCGRSSICVTLNGKTCNMFYPYSDAVNVIGLWDTDNNIVEFLKVGSDDYGIPMIMKTKGFVDCFGDIDVDLLSSKKILRGI